MADHTVTHEVYYGGSWHDVSGEVHEPSNTIVRRGLDQFGGFKPARMSWTFEDPAEKWVPGNPMSPLYGLLGRAMPCRVTVDGSVRAVAEAAVFAPNRTEEFDAATWLGDRPGRGRQWVDFQADGLLARINSWTEPLRSPMYRALSTLPGLLGHWPMEDGRDAEQLSNTVPGGRAATLANVAAGDDEAPDGAASATRLTEADNTSRIDFVFAQASATAGWQVAWTTRLASKPAAIGYLQVISWRTSNGYRWTVDVNQDSYRFRVTDNTGTVLEETIVLHSPNFGEPQNWVTFRMKASESAGTVTAEFAWYVQGQVTPWGTSGTFSGSVGYLDRGSLNGNAYMDEALVSHVYGVTGTSLNLLSAAVRSAFNGYVNEMPADRFGRLLDEEGIAWSVVGDPDTGLPMGRQRPDTLAGQLREIVSTDRSMIYEARTANELVFRTRASLYRQDPVEFTWPGDIAAPFNERYDYVGVANRVTVSQRDGGEATAALESGPMSVLPAPDGIGERKDTIDVNVADEANLPLIASWEVAQGTLAGARFPEITFDLDGTPGIAAKVAGVEIGGRITIDGFRYDLLDLIVLAIQETAQQKRRKVTFTCLPGAVFSEIGVYDEASQRYDSASTTLKTASSPRYFDRFEKPTTPWSGTGGVATSTGAQSHSGARSALLTVSGAPSQAYMRDYSRAVPITPGTTYRTAMWVRSPQALNVLAAIDYVDANFNWVNGVYPATVALVPNTWTRIFAGGAAPVGATQAIFGPTAVSPANGNTLYLDDVVFGDGAAVPDLLVFRTTNPDDLWDTGAEPYDVVVAGEQMTVTTMGSASLVSGAYDQSAIVTRSGNGVLKALDAGEPIHVATPGRYGL